MKVVRGKDYLLCEYCSSLHFPTASQDGVRVLGTSSDHSCPVCQIPLVLASVADADVLHCPRCQGILMMQMLFSHVVKVLRARTPGPPIRPKPLNQKDRQRRLTCPHCERRMETHPYYGPGNVMIDRCTRCALIWLDRGELGTIINAPGRDRRR
jgi:Zn-finger nucleic acid-binding protein